MADIELTAEDLFEGALEELGSPTPQELRPTLLWQKLLDAINFYASKLSLSTNSFLLSKAKVNIIQGKEEYTLDDLPNYGRGIFADILPITSQAGTQRGTIPIVDTTVQTLSSTPHSSSGAFIIYRTVDSPNEFILRVSPIPSASYTAYIWYKPSRLLVAALEDNPGVLEQFYPAVRKRAALTALWHVLRDEMWIKRIEKGLAMEVAGWDDIFESYKNSGNDTGGIKRPASMLFYDDGY